MTAQTRNGPAGRTSGALSRVLRLALGRYSQGGSAAPEAVDETFVLRLQQLRLVARRASLHGLAGEHPSSRRIVAAEFADHRPYSVGDEVRRIDWNAYARSGDLLVKRSQAQEHASLVVFLDVSRSMDWGAVNKLAYARQLAAAVAYVADRTYDRVQVVAVAGHVQATTTVGRGADGLRALLRSLASVPLAASTDLPGAVSSWLSSGEAPMGHPAGLAVLISDLLRSEERRVGKECRSRWSPYH